jgi:aconitase B
MANSSFCHTAAYPKPVDIKTHEELPDFFAQRGGVALRPGDGIIHSWLNRMLLPDTVGTAPNDPDNIKLLSEVAGAKIDEVFVGSCMTNIGHYRATAKVLDGEPAVTTQLWICPPTRMDESQLKAEGMYAIFDAAGARTEMPGCSLCMGNQSLHRR